MFELSFFRNFKKYHLSDAMDIPQYKGHRGKYLRLNEDETGFVYADPFLQEDAIDEKVFEIKDNKIFIKDFISKTDADDRYAFKKHIHLKEDIKDFNEKDFVHTTGDEIVKGSKVFTDKITFNNDIFINGKTTKIETENSYFKDTIVTLAENDGDVKPELAGFEIYRGYDKSAKMLWDENEKVWKAGLGELNVIAFEKDITKLQNEIDANVKNIKDNTASIGKNEADISDLSDKLSNLKSNYDQLKSQALSYFSKVDAIESLIEVTEVKTLKEGEDTITLQNNVFTDKNYLVFRNGMAQIESEDYNLNNNEIKFEDKAEGSDDKILVQYTFKKDS